MSKKNINHFHIAFNEYDEKESFAIEILNSLPSRNKACYIAQAIYKYESKRNKGKKIITETRNKRHFKEKSVQQSIPKKSSDILSSHIQEDLQNEAAVFDKSSSADISNAMVDSMLNFCK